MNHKKQMIDYYYIEKQYKKIVEIANNLSENYKLDYLNYYVGLSYYKSNEFKSALNYFLKYILNENLIGNLQLYEILLIEK